MTTNCRNWQSTIFAASYKGVPFEVESDVTKGGRRIVTHEYPSRESWDNEDLGAAKRTVDVIGYTYGDAGDAWADRLMAACWSAGPGSLVLPTSASRQARCNTAERASTADKMGRFECRMSFVLEAGGVGGLVSFAYLLGAVINTVTSAIGAVRSAFEQDYNARNVPNVAREAATETVKIAAAAFASAAGKTPLDPAKAAMLNHNIGTLSRDARALSFGGEGEDIISATVFASSDLVRSNVLGARIADILTSLSSAATNKADLAMALEPLVVFEAQVIHNPVNCDSVKAERDLTARIARLIRVMSAIKWAEARATAGFPTKQDAVETRATIAETLNREIDVAVSAAELDALSAVRNAAVEYITRNGAERPVTRTVSLHYPNPMAVIAHELYGDPARDDEMIIRNAVPHPLMSTYEFEVAIP